jgi:hypothetical protein
MSFATSLLKLQAAVLQLLFQTAGAVIVSADWGYQQWQGKRPSRSPQKWHASSTFLSSSPH